MRLLNTARVATREGGRFNLANVRQILVDVWRTFRAARTADLVHLQLVADPGLPALRAAALQPGRVRRPRPAGRPRPLRGRQRRPSRVRPLLAGSTGWRCGRCAGPSWSARCPTPAPRPCAPRRAYAGPHRRQRDRRVGVHPDPRRTGCRRPCCSSGWSVAARAPCELARAARLLRERGLTDWRLVVVGGQGPTPEPEYAEIVAEFAAAGLADSLVGPEHGDQVRARLRDADVFVLPSFLEGQPIAIIEAMAAGVPVVGHDGRGHPDLVRDGVEGRVVEPGDVDALADALAELIDRPGAARPDGDGHPRAGRDGAQPAASCRGRWPGCTRRCSRPDSTWATGPRTFWPGRGPVVDGSRCG